jgi:hypothetical protein
VTSSYQIHWTGPTSGTYDGQLPGATSFENHAEVYNDIVSGAIGLRAGTGYQFRERGGRWSEPSLDIR